MVSWEVILADGATLPDQILCLDLGQAGDARRICGAALDALVHAAEHLEVLGREVAVEPIGDLVLRHTAHPVVW